MLNAYDLTLYRIDSASGASSNASLIFRVKPDGRSLCLILKNRGRPIRAPDVKGKRVRYQEQRTETWFVISIR